MPDHFLSLKIYVQLEPRLVFHDLNKRKKNSSLSLKEKERKNSIHSKIRSTSFEEKKKEAVKDKSQEFKNTP